MEEFPNSFPKCGKNRAQQFAEGEDPHKTAGKEACGVADPQVAVAQVEAQIQPGPEGGSHKEEVGNMGIFGPQRTQKIINDAQPCAQQAGQGEAPESLKRGGHRNRRRQKPPGARGSS